LSTLALMVNWLSCHHQTEEDFQQLHLVAAENCQHLHPCCHMPIAAGHNQRKEQQQRRQQMDNQMHDLSNQVQV
jgi:predicted sulfurtransferase